MPGLVCSLPARYFDDSATDFVAGFEDTPEGDIAAEVAGIPREEATVLMLDQARQARQVNDESVVVVVLMPTLMVPLRLLICGGGGGGDGGGHVRGRGRHSRRDGVNERRWIIRRCSRGSRSLGW